MTQTCTLLLHRIHFPPFRPSPRAFSPPAKYRILEDLAEHRQFSSMGITHITVRGARQHNLRNVDVSIPRNTLTVVTGLSGSGKSSLAFDTIYAEGQRRYVETLSAYARQFLDQMERPDVDAIDGLSPAISIEQKTTSRSPRSTVGTITEIYDYLRLLYASVGQPHCPNCGRPITRQSAEQIVERIAALSPGERITVYAPIVRGRKGEFREELEALDQQGFRARIDGEMTELTEGMRLEKRKNHTIEAVVDRIILKPVPPDRQPTTNNEQPTTQIRHPPPRNLRPQSPPDGQRPRPHRPPEPRHAQAGRDPLLLLHGLPRLRHQRPPPRAPQLLLQLQLRRLPQLPRPRQHLRLRPRQDHHRLVQASPRRSHGPRQRLRLSPPPHQARRRKIQDQHQASLRGPHHRAAEPLPLRPTAQRSRPHRLPRHLQLPPLQPRRHQIRGLPRVHDAVHVRDHLPRLPRPPPPPRIPRRHHPHPHPTLQRHPKQKLRHPEQSAQFR